MFSNALFSFICKMLQTLCSFLVVRNLVIKMGVEEYGSWVTMTSILAWIMLFDFGIGYGLKNRLSEAYALHSMHKIKDLVSRVLTFYCLATIILFILFFVACFFVSPFNTRLSIAVLLVASASLTFFCSFGSVVLQGVGGFKRLAVVTLILPILWFLYVSFFAAESLSMFTAAIFYFSFVFAQGCCLFYLGCREIGSIRLQLKGLFSTELCAVLKSSFGFFLLQLSSLALFMSGNFIVYQQLGSKEAAAYDLMNKVFQLFNVGFSILITIAWTEISKAKAVGNVKKKVLILKGLLFFSVLVGVFSLLMAVYIAEVIHLVSGSKIHAETKDAIGFSLLVFVQSLAYSGAVFMNAYEKLKPQILLALLSIPIFIALIFVSFRLNLGIFGIPFSCCLAILPSMFCCVFYGFKLSKAPL